MFDDWHVVELYLEATNNHATVIGKYWITLFLVLRFLVLIAFAGDAFDVEKSSMDMIECDTNTPGCQRMCTNHFYPILPTDYWALEMVFVSLPLCIALTYISHKTEKIHRTKKWLANENKKRLDRVKQQIEHDKVTLARKRSVYQLWQQPNGQELTNEQIEELLGEKEAEIELEQDKIENGEDDSHEKATHASTPKLFLTYVIMVCVRCAIEILFLFGYFQLYVFRLTVPTTYKCDRSPCNEEVNCYIDRADQKTIAVHIMVATSIVSISVGLIEIFYLVTKRNGGKSELGTAIKRRHDDITKTAKHLHNDSHLKVIL